MRPNPGARKFGCHTLRREPGWSQGITRVTVPGGLRPRDWGGGRESHRGNIWELPCSLLGPAQSRNAKVRQHQSPQLWEPRTILHAFGCHFPNACGPSLWLFPPPSSLSRLIQLLPEDSAQVSAPPESKPLGSTLPPAPPSVQRLAMPLRTLRTLTLPAGRLTRWELS